MLGINKTITLDVPKVRQEIWKIGEQWGAQDCIHSYVRDRYVHELGS